MRELIGKCSAACLAAVVSFTPAHAQTAAELAKERFDVDPQHSTVAFASTIIGAVHVRGRFTAYDGTVIWDPAHSDRASVSVVIDAKSINTDMPYRDDHLRSADFFDVAKYPTIEFVSDRVAPRNGGRDAMLSGTLTMHGVSRHITFPAKVLLTPHLTGNTLSVAFSAELKLNRNDYGIAGTNKFNPDYNPLTNMLSDSVSLLLEINAIRSPYAGRMLGWGTPPGVSDTVNKVLQARGVPAALDAFRSLRERQPTMFRYTPGELDVIGHQLAEAGRLREAIEVLTFNAQLFGDSPGILESLGEAEAQANDASAALETYRRALSKFPGSTAAREMVRHLEHATTKSK